LSDTTTATPSRPKSPFQPQANERDQRKKEKKKKQKKTKKTKSFFHSLDLRLFVSHLSLFRQTPLHDILTSLQKPSTQIVRPKNRPKTQKMRRWVTVGFRRRELSNEAFTLEKENSWRNASKLGIEHSVVALCFFFLFS
jgi:hypothetical protein